MSVNDFSSIRVNGSLPDPKSINVDEVVIELWMPYVDSVTTALPKLERMALAYEAGKSLEDNAAGIRRTLHSIKGEAGMCGVMDVYKLCHEAEFGFEELKDHSQAGDMVLKVKDWIEAAVKYVSDNGLRKHDDKSQGLAANVDPNTDTAKIKEKRIAKKDRRTGPKADVSNAKEKRIAKKGRRGVDSSKIKTLVIEDSEVCSRMIGILLKDYCECHFACNGREGFKMFEEAVLTEEPFQLITLDIQMPVMDGHQTLKVIRKCESKNGIYGLDGIKIIMTTSQEEAEHVFKAFRGGCEAYVTKPVGGKLLKEMSDLGLLKVKPQYSLA